MKGSGCRYFERNNPDKDWEELLLSFHTYFDMKTTRIDIAIDYFDGDVIPFNWLWQKIEKRKAILQHLTHHLHLLKMNVMVH